MVLFVFSYKFSKRQNQIRDPPPVSFSPPKAPPISAPEVPIFTLAIPQSRPETDKTILLLSNYWSLLQMIVLVQHHFVFQWHFQ